MIPRFPCRKTDEPVYYTDEWFGKIATGDVGQSSQEEVKAVKKTENQRKIDIIDKRKVSRSAELTILNNKNIERKGYEAELLRTVQALMSHERRPEMDGVEEAYSNEQKGSFSQITELIRKLSLVDKEVARSIMRIEGLDREIEDLSGKVEGVTMVTRVDVDTIVQEFNTVRQMAKLCVGRQGNHFPILMKQYFRPSMTEMATRENVINIMTEIEYLDPELFMRTYKRQITRIVPYLIIIPSYGEQGICWEPFDRKNRLTGRGRVALPMFPKNLREAIIYALADLRWQVAKEKAMHYWMEEGFTGRYYQWFDSKKLKGDVKDYFIRDYLLWITKESEGTQKLDKDVRGIFWRMLPFPQEVKDKLRNRGFVFNELYKKDMNRAMSDGY